MKRYTAIFERDESGSWLARIPSIRGCHTYGRTLEQARTRLREALGLWVDRPEHAVIEEAIRLPADLRTAIQRSRRTRERAERERENASLRQELADRDRTLARPAEAASPGDLGSAWTA